MSKPENLSVIVTYTKQATKWQGQSVKCYAVADDSAAQELLRYMLDDPNVLSARIGP